MVYNIHITDLLYNSKNVDNNSDFILIHSDNMDNILFKIGFMHQTSIYDYNIEYIKKILNDNDFNPDNFVFIYQIQTNNLGDLNYIIMANKKVTKPIQNYVSIDKDIEGNTLWSPQDPKYSYIGLVYTPYNKKPNYNLHGMIDNAFIYENFNNRLCYVSHPSVRHLDISKEYVKHRFTRKMFNYDSHHNILYYDIGKNADNYYDVNNNGEIKLNNSKDPWFEHILDDNIGINISNDNDHDYENTPIITNKNEIDNYRSYKIISLISIFIIIACILAKTMLY